MMIKHSVFKIEDIEKLHTDGSDSELKNLLKVDFNETINKENVDIETSGTKLS